MSTLYRFRIEISDVDRGFYEPIDFRAAMHPSETEDYLLTRVLAYALNFAPGLTLLPGLCSGDEPAMQLADPSSGKALLWIEVGNPSARKLHRAAKAARQVRVYTYKNPELLRTECAGENIHHANEIEIFALDPALLKPLAARLKRDNSWTLIHHEGELTIGIEGESLSGSIARSRL